MDSSATWGPPVDYWVYVEAVGVRVFGFLFPPLSPLDRVVGGRILRCAPQSTSWTARDCVTDTCIRLVALDPLVEVAHVTSDEISQLIIAVLLNFALVFDPLPKGVPLETRKPLPSQSVPDSLLVGSGCSEQKGIDNAFDLVLCEVAKALRADLQSMNGLMARISSMVSMTVAVTMLMHMNMGLSFFLFRHPHLRGRHAQVSSANR
ncbi:unnamed protein product [Fusarium graminearum]|nr:unnamed protein product [Fusarium graminearum]